MKKKTWIIILVSFFLLVLLATGFLFRKQIFNIFADIVVTNVPKCGDNICSSDAGENSKICPSDCLNENEYIFSYWPVFITSSVQSNISAVLSAVDQMRETGMNFAGITFRPNHRQIAEDNYLKVLLEKGLKTALEVSAGHYTTGGRPELLSDGDDSKQYLSAQCLKIDKCENWNKKSSVDPSYTGVLWQNTLDNLREVAETAKPPIVLIDTELWGDPEKIEYYYMNGDPGRDCDCAVVKEGIGYEKYLSSKAERYAEIKEVVKTVNADTQIFFYNELPKDGVRWYQNYKGDYLSGNSSYVAPGTGDEPSPSLYTLPNTELLEMTFKNMDMRNTVPWVSFSYMVGFSNYNKDDLYFDPSVSREAGRMLRRAGTKGFLVYPNSYNLKSKLEGKGSEYWLAHAKAMTDGFKEGLTYEEKNKIKNNSFEAFKSKADGYGKDANGNSVLTGDLRKIPVYWEWEDAIDQKSDLSSVANLSEENGGGMYSWRHNLKSGAKRTLASQEFEILNTEAEKFVFSGSFKSNGKSNLKVKIVSSQESQDIAQKELITDWENITGGAELSQGKYQLVIELDNMSATAPVEIYVDNISLKQGEQTDNQNLCGNGVCDSNEDSSSCPADCPTQNSEDQPQVGINGSSDQPPVITSLNIEEGQEINKNPFAIEVKGSDDVGISKVEFYVNDEKVKESALPDLAGVYSYNWITTAFFDREVTIKIIVYDTKNQTDTALRKAKVLSASSKYIVPVLPRTGSPNRFLWLKLPIFDQLFQRASR